MTAAPLAERIIEKGLASDAGVINAIVVKYCDYVPLYRQAVMLEREAGIEIGRATLDGWVMRVGELRVGELLQPVVGAMRRDLVKASYLQADETPVPVQMHDRRGSAYLWQYGKPGGETVFDFCLGRGRDGPRKFLGDWEGILETDGYQAYENIGGPKVVHVGCWAHYLDPSVIQSKCRMGAPRRSGNRAGGMSTPDKTSQTFEECQQLW